MGTHASNSASLEELTVPQTSSQSAALEHVHVPFFGRKNQSIQVFCELVVFGFIREMEHNEFASSSLIIPTAVCRLVLNFYPVIREFKWSETNKGAEMEIIANCTLKAGTKWTSCIADFYVDASMTDWFEWTIELIDWKRDLPHNAQPALMMGFVAHPFESSIKSFDTYLGGNNVENNSSEHFMVNVCYIDSFRLFGNNQFGGKLKHNTPTSIRFKSGDKIKMKVDFVRKECKIYYNGQKLGIAYKNIPENGVLPAVSLHRGQIRVCRWNAAFK